MLLSYIVLVYCVCVSVGCGRIELVMVVLWLPVFHYTLCYTVLRSLFFCMFDCVWVSCTVPLVRGHKTNTFDSTMETRHSCAKRLIFIKISAGQVSGPLCGGQPLYYICMNVFFFVSVWKVYVKTRQVKLCVHIY